MKTSAKIITGAAVAAGVTAGVGYIVFNEVMNRNAIIYPKIAEIASKKLVQSEKKPDDPRVTWFREQEYENFELINSKGFRLKAKMIAAENESKVFAVCSHGYRSCGSNEYGNMAKFYHDLGYNVFIVDHQAHGESDGKYIGFGYHESKDLLLWVNYLIEKYGNDIQIILEGISMGSATVMMLSGDPLLPENVKFTVADCGYTSAEAEFESALKQFAKLPKYPIIPAADVFNKLINGYKFEDASPVKAVANAKIPMLFIHGGSDDFVPTSMVYELYDAYGGEYKDLLIVEGAGHAESYRVNSEAYEAKVKEFADKFIEK